MANENLINNLLFTRKSINFECKLTSTHRQREDILSVALRNSFHLPAKFHQLRLPFFFMWTEKQLLLNTIQCQMPIFNMIEFAFLMQATYVGIAVVEIEF